MKVALFVTCFNDTMFPESAKGTVELLERLGVDVDFPAGQSCCGQMHLNTGYRTEAVPLVRRHVETFEGYDAVVAPSASCAGTVQDYHHKIAAERGDAALRDGVAGVAPKTYEHSLTLVPDVHVCIVRTEDGVEGVQGPRALHVTAVGGDRS